MHEKLLLTCVQMALRARGDRMLLHECPCTKCNIHMGLLQNATNQEMNAGSKDEQSNPSYLLQQEDAKCCCCCCCCCCCWQASKSEARLQGMRLYDKALLN